jgi:hypothetical protein
MASMILEAMGLTPVAFFIHTQGKLGIRSAETTGERRFGTVTGPLDGVRVVTSRQTQYFEIVSRDKVSGARKHLASSRAFAHLLS